MALPPLATIDDLAVWLRKGVFSADDETAAELVLKQVSSLIRGSASETWVDENGDLIDLPEGVEGLALSVAARIWENPTFVSQRTTGPFSISFGPNTGLFLTEDEIATLPSPSGFRGIGTIATTRGPVETLSGTSPWVNDPDVGPWE